MLYRSNHLANLTARDSDYLNRLGIRLVCDVRSEGERARAPDHWTGNAPEFFSVPIGSNLITTPTADDLKRRIASINSETKDSVRAYDYAVDYAGQYAKILRRIAAGDLPAVEHCTAGKDRTGVFSAILLTALARCPARHRCPGLPAVQRIPARPGHNRNHDCRSSARLRPRRGTGHLHRQNHHDRETRDPRSHS
jgi:protein tyrosine/serine phosphatase